MIAMSVILEGDNAWPDLKSKPLIHLADGAPPIQVAVLAGAMASGRPSVALRIDLPDGQHVIVETSARLFCTAGRMILAKYPGLLDEDQPAEEGGRA